jgi:large conductance mechanosensitive channel
MFLVVKAYNRMKKPAEAAAEAEEIVLLRDIRDSLRRS